MLFVYLNGELYNTRVTRGNVMHGKNIIQIAAEKDIHGLQKSVRFSQSRLQTRDIKNLMIMIM